MKERRGIRSIAVIGPEGTELSFELAGLGERLFAVLFDLFVLTVAWIGTVLVMAFAGALTGELAFAVGMVLLFVVRQGYFAFFETVWQGATPGKRFIGIRVISRDGGRLPVEALVARNVMRDLETFIPLVFLLAPEALIGRAPGWLAYPAGIWLVLIALLPILSEERTRAGDLIGGTVVVRIPKAQLLPDEAGSANAALIHFSREQLAIYGEHELETLADILRALDAGHASLDDLRLIARTIARKVAYQGREPEQVPAPFLREFYRQQRAELERRLLLGRRKASKHDLAG